MVLVFAAVWQCGGQDGGCGDNLVQSLQQCAAAINNNEQLSVQQEKCAPNDGNYDCPSLNALETIEEIFEAKLLALHQMVINNSIVLQKIRSIQQNNTDAIASNTQDIAFLS